MNAIKKAIKKSIVGFRKIRLMFFRNTIGKRVEICQHTYVTHSKIGNYCYLGMYSYFNHVEIGNYCSISGFVTIGAMEHDYHDISTSTHLGDGGYSDHVTHIGNDVWIGAQCVVRQGVTIGDGAVIGANSFVNKDIPPYAIAFGTPIKVYKYRFDGERIKQIQESRFWNSPPKEAFKLIERIKNNQKEQ